MFKILDLMTVCLQQGKITMLDFISLYSKLNINKELKNLTREELQVLNFKLNNND